MKEGAGEDRNRGGREKPAGQESGVQCLEQPGIYEALVVVVSYNFQAERKPVFLKSGL